MRIKLVELRKVIRSVIREANDRPTISSDLDPGEKELQDKFPSWGSPQARREKEKGLKQDSPAVAKAKKVTAILQAKGLTADAGHKKKVTQELVPYIENMDPGDAFVMDPDDIAAQFAAEVLGVQQN